MRIALIVDSFKGSMSSLEVAEELRQHFEPQHECVIVPISDGGEGFLSALKFERDYQIETIRVSGPLGKLVDTYYFLDHAHAFIELSLSSGLSILTREELNPLKTSTRGIGETILDAIQKGAKEITIGVGGSSTNDGGTGMLQALGIKFYADEVEITEPMNGELLGKVTSLNLDQLLRTIEGISFNVAYDVSNVLLGKEGSTHTYAAQKGASPSMVHQLETNMQHFARLTEQTISKDYSSEEGAGAAGGFAFGAMSYLNSSLVSGIDFVLEKLDVEKIISSSDLVFVGEGKLDHQSLKGKAPFGVAKLAKKYQKRVIGVFAISEFEDPIELFDETHIIVPKFASFEESIMNPHRSLRQLIATLEV